MTQATPDTHLRAWYAEAMAGRLMRGAMDGMRGAMDGEVHAGSQVGSSTATSPLGTTPTSQSGTTQSATEAEAVPVSCWGELLSSFSKNYRGAQVYIRVFEADGKPRLLDCVDSPGAENVDLRLMSLGEEQRRGQRIVRLFAHRHPGAEIAQIEFAGAVRLTRRGLNLTVGAADGCRMELQVSGARAPASV